MVDIIIDSNIDINFDFKKYCNLILGLVPKNDLLKLPKIRFIFSQTNGSKEKAIATYFPSASSGYICIDLSQLMIEQIPEYLFKDYHEIAALYLSEVIGHEIGHHAHTFWRHGIKEKEDFANNYAIALYYRYFLHRKFFITLNFNTAILNIFQFNKSERVQIRNAKKELIEWISLGKDISFP